MRTLLCSAGTSVARDVRFRGDVTEFRKAVLDRVQSLRREHANGPGGMVGFQRVVCAEVNSLRAMGAGADDDVVLLQTDTPDGEVCASVVSKLIEEEFGARVRAQKIPGLQVTDPLIFRREGVRNLFAALGRLESDAKGPVTLNVTGGFKSVVPYVTLYGLLRRVPVAYLFEYSEQLITLPVAPITFDYERVAQALDALRILEQRGGMAREEFWQELGVGFAERDAFECLLEEDGEVVFPSAFGFLLLGSGTDPGRVLLSTAARETYDGSRAQTRSQYTFILERIREPLSRSVHVHAFARTDLQIYKPGNTSERAAYYVRGRDVHVCALAQHDTYERTFAALRREQFENERFTEWSRPADQPEPERTETERLTRLGHDLEESLRLADEAETRANHLAAALERERAGAQQLRDEHTAESQALGELAEGLRRDLGTVRAELVEARRERDLLGEVVRQIDEGRLAGAFRIAKGIARRSVRGIVARRR